MAKQIVEILSPAKTIATLYSGPATWAEAESTITTLDNFDDFSNIVVETVPKLFGAGSYIKHKRIAESDIVLVGRVYLTTVRNILSDLKSSAQKFENITIKRTITSAGSVEQITGLITSVTWNEIDELEAEFTVNIKAISPLKTLTVGTTTTNTL